MPSFSILLVLLGVTGLVVGAGLATLTVRLPRDTGVAGPLPDYRTLISPRYLLVQAAAAGIGVWAAMTGGGWPMAVATAILGWQLLLIAVIDAENFWLPDVLTWPLVATGLIATALITQGMPWDAVVGAAVGFSGLWLLGRVYQRVRRRDGLGGGDPFLLAGAGAWVGWPGLPGVLMTACAAALALVLLRLLFRQRVRGGDRLPFGTLLALGVWLTWLYAMPGGSL